jgi:hypothetical protein
MRRVRFLCLAAILITAAVGVLFLYLLRDPATWSNFRTIETGMTKEQVRRILGPAKDQCAATDIHQPTGVTAERVMRWFGNEGLIEVGFDQDGAVTWKRFTAGARHTDVRD